MPPAPCLGCPLLPRFRRLTLRNSSALASAATHGRGRIRRIAARGARAISPTRTTASTRFGRDARWMRVPSRSNSSAARCLLAVPSRLRASPLEARRPESYLRGMVRASRPAPPEASRRQPTAATRAPWRAAESFEACRKVSCIATSVCEVRYEVRYENVGLKQVRAGHGAHAAWRMERGVWSGGRPAQSGPDRSHRESRL